MLTELGIWFLVFHVYPFPLSHYPCRTGVSPIFLVGGSSHIVLSVFVHSYFKHSVLVFWWWRRWIPFGHTKLKMSIREPRWYDKHTSSTYKSKVGLLVLSHTHYVGPLLWEIHLWSKFLFNVAPMIKHSIPDDGWPTRRTSAYCIILRDCRDYWCLVLSPPKPCHFSACQPDLLPPAPGHLSQGLSLATRAHLSYAQSQVPMNEHAPGKLEWQCHCFHCSVEVTLRCMFSALLSPQQHQAPAIHMATGLYSPSLAPQPLQEEVLWGHVPN